MPSEGDMTSTGRAGRTAARTTVALGALGLVLSASPAWAIDPLPAPPAPLVPVVAGLPLPLPSGLPSPSPSASPLGQLTPTRTVPQAQTAPKPVTAPKPAPTAARPAASHPAPARPTPVPAATPLQEAQIFGALVPMSASLAIGNDRPALASLPGVLLAPELAPTVEIRNSAATGSPISSVPGGLPGLLVAAAVLVVGSAGAGQLAALRARRRTTA
jgi:hypothetical protein